MKIYRRTAAVMASLTLSLAIPGIINCPVSSRFGTRNQANKECNSRVSMTSISQ
jgi:hypothetical protein